MKTKHPKVLKRLAIAFAIVIAATVIYLQFLAPHTLEARIRTQLESTQTQLIEAREALEQSQTSDEAKQKQIEEINQKLLETEQQLQAKREASSVAAAAVAPAKPVFQATGSKQDWLVASGIPEHEWPYVDNIVTRESGWNPNAVNKSSGACGLGQQLPCGKWAGTWNDPVAALKAMDGYVKDRYGGWSQAVAFWNVNHWY